MKNETWFKGLCLYQRSIAVIICLILLSVGSVSVAAVVNHMDIPTLIASWSTKQVSVNQLRQGQLKPVILIDVRSPEEYAQDHIGQSLLVPLTDIEADFGVKRIRAIAQSSGNSDQTQPTLVLYCTSGMRSVKAYHRLEKTGLNIVVLSGGITAWRKAVLAQKDAEVLAPITKPV